jgi:hypothetical protein
MEEFIPSGYMDLGAVIDRVNEADNGPILATVRSHIAEFNELKARRRSAGPNPDCSGTEDSQLRRLMELTEERRLLAQAREKVIDTVWQALGDGALASEVLTDHGFVFPLRREFWRSRGARNALITQRVRSYLFEVDPPLQLNGRPLVERSAFERWLAGTTTSAGERRLSHRLERQMRAAPTEPVPKLAMKEKARSEGYSFSDEGFDRAWRQAAEAANAPQWLSAGRRRTQQLADNPGPERR